MNHINVLYFSAWLDPSDIYSPDRTMMPALKGDRWQAVVYATIHPTTNAVTVAAITVLSDSYKSIDVRDLLTSACLERVHDQSVQVALAHKYI